jgi:hypothetical protein
MKICPLATKMFHADGQTTKLIVAFHNFAKKPKNYYYKLRSAWVLTYNLVPVGPAFQEFYGNCYVQQKLWTHC